MEIIEIKKGWIIACVISGDYGKPRPAVVIQSNLHKNHSSVTVCPLTTHYNRCSKFSHSIKSHKVEWS